MTTINYIFIVAILAASAIAHAGEPPTAPILRINTNMHSASIYDLTTNSDISQFITASRDKTAKVWNLADGKLLRTLRVPIADGYEGALNAAVWSPDGQWLALAGSTAKAWDGSASIYLLNPDSGDILHRLSGLPGNVLGLCMSPDGSRLAATLREGGVRQWQTGDWAQIAADSNYTERSGDCAYTKDNRLLTSSADGKLRLYNPDGTLSGSITAGGGDWLGEVAIHPDGNRFAVGHNDNNTIKLGTLQPFVITDAANTPSSDKYDSLGTVAWSADGNTLYAGGMYNRGNGFPIWSWDNAGLGSRSSLSNAADTNTKIRTFSDGSRLITSADPMWRLVNADGNVIRKQTGNIFDNRDKLGRAFQISDDGKKIFTGRGQGDRDPVTIDLTQGTVQTGSDSAGLHRANTNGLDIRNWEVSYQPTLNGQLIPIDDKERSLSRTIAADAQSFAMGADYHLYRFNANGSEQWHVDTPAGVWGVNFTAQDQLVVAALGDGTIRWYRYADGQELLALFVDRHSLEWVIWTPQGYYDASAGGQRLIGWHVNRGAEHKPDFYTIDACQDDLRRPILIRNIFETHDFERARQQAAAQGEHTAARINLGGLTCVGGDGNTEPLPEDNTPDDNTPSGDNGQSCPVNSAMLSEPQSWDEADISKINAGIAEAAANNADWVKRPMWVALYAFNDQANNVTITTANEGEYPSSMTIEAEYSGYMDDSVSGSRYKLDLVRKEDIWYVAKLRVAHACYRDGSGEYKVGMCL